MSDLMSELLAALFTMALSFSILLAAVSADFLGISEVLPDTAVLVISLVSGIAVFLIMHLDIR